MYNKPFEQCSSSRRNDQFRDAVVAREAEDLKQVQHKLGRALDDREQNRCGVSQLRQFLEQLLQQRYLESVPTILPLLEQEFRTAVRSSPCLEEACF